MHEWVRGLNEGHKVSVSFFAKQVPFNDVELALLLRIPVLLFNQNEFSACELNKQALLDLVVPAWDAVSLKSMRDDIRLIELGLNIFLFAF